MNKDQGIGGLILIGCVVIAIGYILSLFWPTLEAIRLWIIAIPVVVAFIAVLSIGAWIGWTMATTRPPTPIDETIDKETIKGQKEND